MEPLTVEVALIATIGATGLRLLTVPATVEAALIVATGSIFLPLTDPETVDVALIVPEPIGVSPPAAVTCNTAV